MNQAALELVEADGYGEIFRAAPDSVRRAHGVDVCEVAGATCILLGAAVGNLMLNRVNGLGLRDPSATRSWTRSTPSSAPAARDTQSASARSRRPISRRVSPSAASSRATRG